MPGAVLMKNISEGVAAMNAKRTISDEQKAYFINRVPGTVFQFPNTKGNRLSILWDILLPWMDYFVCRVFCSLCQHIKVNGLTFLLRPLIRSGRMRRKHNIAIPLRFQGQDGCVSPNNGQASLSRRPDLVTGRAQQTIPRINNSMSWTLWSAWYCAPGSPRWRYPPRRYGRVYQYGKF